jgi:hypothetical protein
MVGTARPEDRARTCMLGDWIVVPLGGSVWMRSDRSSPTELVPGSQAKTCLPMVSSHRMMLAIEQRARRCSNQTPHEPPLHDFGVAGGYRAESSLSRTPVWQRCRLAVLRCDRAADACAATVQARPQPAIRPVRSLTTAAAAFRAEPCCS